MVNEIIANAMIEIIVIYFFIQIKLNFLFFIKELICERDLSLVQTKAKMPMNDFKSLFTIQLISDIICEQLTYFDRVQLQSAIIQNDTCINLVNEYESYHKK